MNKLDKLRKEIEDREKHCPEEVYEQGGKWNYTDVLKAKLEGYLSCKKELDREIKKIEKYYIKDKWIRKNVWELFYPDGTSSLMNYDPIKQKEEEFLKMLEDITEGEWEEVVKAKKDSDLLYIFKQMIKLKMRLKVNEQ